MKTICGNIRAGNLECFAVRTHPELESPPLLNSQSVQSVADLDFIAKRDRMQARGDDRVTNCINFFAACSYRTAGQMDRVRQLAKDIPPKGGAPTP